MLTLMTNQLIFIDGMGEKAATYEKLADLVDYPDAKLLSYGELCEPEQPYSIEQAALTLGDHLSAVGVTSTVLVGTSIGAKIATEFAANHPQFVRGVVLVGLPANSSPDDLIKRLRSLRFVPKKLLPIPAGYDKDGFKGILTAAHNYEAETTLPGLTMPTAVLYGVKDDARSESIEQIVGELEESRFATVPGGHFLASDNPSALAQEIRAMIEETGL